jgi:outer membrane lipopolysaccharide assembly protein LptE/RlpB
MDYKKYYRLGRLKLCLILLLTIISGCGYHFVGGEDNIDPSIQRVFVDSFVNRTSEAGIENLFRNAFIDQVLRGGRFQLAGRREEADAIIRGNIHRLSTSHLSYRRTDLTAEERITIVMEVTFEERVSKKILWQNRNFSYNNDYVVSSGSVSATEAGRKSALIKLSNDTAERIYSLILSGF